MANGTIVKYKKVYKVTIEGKSDTAHPEEKPMTQSVAEEALHALVLALDGQYAWRDVTIKELRR